MEMTAGASAPELNEKDLEWAQLIEEWRNSGKSIAEWVRERGEFPYHQFIDARKRLYPEDIRKSEFLEQETTWSALAIELPLSTIDVHVNGCKVVIGSGFDQDLLRELVEVLKDAN